MNIYKVFRTDDGEIFDTKKEAEEYVAEEQRLEKLVNYCRERFVCASDDFVREILIVLAEEYEIVPKHE